MKVDKPNTLPDGWIWTTIGNITEPILKINPKDSPASQFTYLDISSIDNSIQQIINPKQYKGSDAPSRARQLVKTNDVLFSTVRTYLRNVSLVPEIYDGQVASTGFSVIRANSTSIGKYLFYYTLTDSFLNPLNELQRGTSYPAVRDSDVREQPIPLPPLPEQERIVERIESLFTQLDAGVAGLKRVRAALKRYKASVLKAAVEGRLVEQDPNDEPAEELLKRNGKKPLEQDDLNDHPTGWCWVTVGGLVSDEPYSFTDGPFGSKLKTSHYTDSGPRVIRLQNIGDGIFNNEYAHISQNHFETLRKHEIFSGDLVIGALGDSLPRACIIPDYVGQAIVKADCMRFKPHPNVALSHYLRTALNSDVVKKQAKKIIHGIGRPRLNQTEVKSLPIPLPPINEQTRIVIEVERRLSVIQELEKSIDDNLKRADRLRQAILQRAFEGRLG